MRKGILKTYINAVEDKYEEACANIQSMCGETEGFRVKVGVHQGSALSPYLFSVVMDVVIKKYSWRYTMVYIIYR